MYKLEHYKTPKTDAMLELHNFLTPDGQILKDTVTNTQKLIMEIILTRGRIFNNEKESYEVWKRIHCECITRYGKSMIVGCAVAIRASTAGDEWAIVAPTQDKAQIIMDYAIHFTLSSELLRGNMTVDTETSKKIDKLKESKAKDRITFKRGGQIRAFTAGQKSGSNKRSGDALMGYGCPNVIEDECYLIDDNTHSKVMRMLGDNPHDNFLFKIGNPFKRNHGLKSRNNPKYYKVIVDYKQALLEGRMSEEFISEQRGTPNFSVLYECIPPEQDTIDSDGYLSLFPEELIARAQIKRSDVKPFGPRYDGMDLSDGGENYSVIVGRHSNVADIVFAQKGIRLMDMQGHVHVHCSRSKYVNGDASGVGSGLCQMMEKDAMFRDKFNSVKVGVKSSDPERFYNLRAEIFWKTHEWLSSGGKLIEDSRWLELSVIKYKTDKKGRIQIISKEELRKMGIPSPDFADGLSLTFAPEPPAVINTQSGGINDSYGGGPYGVYGAY